MGVFTVRPYDLNTSLNLHFENSLAHEVQKAVENCVWMLVVIGKKRLKGSQRSSIVKGEKIVTLPPK